MSGSLWANATWIGENAEGDRASQEVTPTPHLFNLLRSTFHTQVSSALILSACVCVGVYTCVRVGVCGMCCHKPCLLIAMKMYLSSFRGSTLEEATDNIIQVQIPAIKDLCEKGGSMGDDMKPTVWCVICLSCLSSRRFARGQY